jgi:hypothetical protein
MIAMTISDLPGVGPYPRMLGVVANADTGPLDGG